MNSLEEQVTNLYTNEFLSEKQISDNLCVEPKHVRRILNHAKVARRTRSEASTYLYKTKFEYKDFSIKENLSQKEELLKTAGIMLYWGEGTKEHGSVALANSNPEMIKLFVHFLKVICGIDMNRLHATVHYYEDHSIDGLTNFWSGVVGIPSSQFYKPFLHKKNSGTYRNPSKYGTISIQYSDSKLLKVIVGWIKEYSVLMTSSSYSSQS